MITCPRLSLFLACVEKTGESGGNEACDNLLEDVLYATFFNSQDKRIHVVQFNFSSLMKRRIIRGKVGWDYFCPLLQEDPHAILSLSFSLLTHAARKQMS